MGPRSVPCSPLLLQSQPRPRAGHLPAPPHDSERKYTHIYTCTMYLYINVVEHPSRMRDVMGSNPAQDSSFFILRKSLAAFGIWICLALSFMYIYLFTCSSMVIYVCRAMQSNYFRVSYEEVETSTSSRECSLVLFGYFHSRASIISL